jgi:Mg-chelatase subunit ChlI
MKLRLLLSLSGCPHIRDLVAAEVTRRNTPVSEGTQVRLLASAATNARAILVALVLSSLAARAETADDFFHGGAVNYLSNNIPQALEVVTNGRALFPDDIKLKKLEELLKRQSQQQSQNNQQKQDKQNQQQQDQQQQQQQKEEQQQSQAQPQKQEEKQAQSGSAQSSQEEKKQNEQREAAPARAGQMTPQQARQLLDAQKAEEAMIPIKLEEKPESRERVIKDW